MPYDVNPERFVHVKVVGERPQQSDVHRPQVSGGPGEAITFMLGLC